MTKYKPVCVADMPGIAPSYRGSTFGRTQRCSAPCRFGKQQTAISAATQLQMRSFFVSSKATELSTKVTTAEVRFAQFAAEHNHSFSVADCLTKLVKGSFPDSDIASKTTMIIKKALAPRKH